MKDGIVLTMRGICKRFPGVMALDRVDFTLRKGEIHALMGENGAGKSTLIKVLTGVYAKDAGEIHVDGVDEAISIRSPQEAQSYGISTVYQEISLCPNLTVAENMFIGRTEGKTVNWKAMEKRAGELLDSLGIPARPRQQLSSCSLAVQQMVAIARAVDTDCKVLILDEPTSSLDDKEVAMLFRLMRDLKARGVTKLKYIVATHYDADHLFGAVGALEAFPVEKVLVPDYETDTYVYQSFRNHLAGKKAEVIHPSPGDSYTLGTCRFTVLAPCGTAYEAENDYSLAFRLTDGEHSLLVTGDAELESETEMLANNRGERRLKSDVYLVGHHGSASSSSAAFLAAVKPSFAVISCGAGNDYGHPKEAVLSRLKLLGTALYRTDKQGDIVFLFTEEGILWEQAPANDFTAG